MAKEKTDFIEFRTLRAGQNGCVIIISPTASGDMIFEMANQYGVTNQNGRNLPQFDYQNKTVFGLKDLEMAELSLMIERQLMSGGFEAKVSFPHLESKVPKTINFEFTQYKGSPQMKVSVSHQGGNGFYSLFLNQFEMEVVKEYCKAQYNPASKRITMEFFDNRKFKNYVAETIGMLLSGGNNGNN